MKLIVGLGNPGKEYNGTRHNIGREVVRALAEEWTLDWKLEKKLLAKTVRYNTMAEKFTIVNKAANDSTAIFAIPTTYMNDSGHAVKKLLTTYNLQLTTLLVVHDDLDLPLGTLRFSQGSGAAGQKGVQSIIDALGTKDFARLRIGVAGEHRATTDAAAYVLKKFSREEQSIVKKIKKRAVEALVHSSRMSLSELMNRYNRS